MKALNQHKGMHQQCSIKSQGKQEQPAILKAMSVVETAAQPSSSYWQFSSAIEDVIYPIDGMIPCNLKLLHVDT